MMINLFCHHIHIKVVTCICKCNSFNRGLQFVVSKQDNRLLCLLGSKVLNFCSDMQCLKSQTFFNSFAKNRLDRLVVQLRNASIGGCRPAPKEYLPQVDLQFFSIRLRRILKLEITPKADILWGPACNPRYYYSLKIDIST